MKKTHRYDESYSLNPSVKLWHLAALSGRLSCGHRACPSRTLHRQTIFGFESSRTILHIRYFVNPPEKPSDFKGFRHPDHSVIASEARQSVLHSFYVETLFLYNKWRKQKCSLGFPQTANYFNYE